MRRFFRLGATLIAALALAAPSFAAAPDGAALIAAGEKLKAQLDAGAKGSTPPMLTNAGGALVRTAFDADTVRALPLDDVTLVGNACVAIGNAVVAYAGYLGRATDSPAAADALGLKVQDELTLGTIAANLCAQRSLLAVEVLLKSLPANQRTGVAGPLKQMRDGARQMITGTLDTALSTGLKPANAAKMLAAALEDAANVAASFPAAERAALRTQILGFVPRAPAASRKDVELLARVFAASDCNLLCQIAGSTP
jgi:hypothetical protein